ncbi:MAG: chromosome segregation protein SMC, partial [Acutalibacteraceae bacterium]
KAEIDKLNLDAEEMNRRANILSDLEKNLEGFSHAVKIVMEHSKKHELGGICGPVSRLISVPEEYSIAIEVALGSAMQNIVTKTEEDAKRAIALLKKNKSGRATFLPLNVIKPRVFNEKGIEDTYGFVGIASELCTCSKEYSNIISNLLGRIVIAEDINCAVSLAKKYGYKFKVVTLDGQVVNAGGSLTGGSFNKKTGLLSRSADIDKYRKSAEKYKNEAETKGKDLKNFENEASKCEAEILGAKADLSRNEQELIRINTEFKSCKNEILRAEGDLASIKSEIEISQDKISGANDDKEKASKEIESLNLLIKEAETESAEISGNRLSLSEKREEISSVLQNLRLEIVSYEKDIESINAEISLSLGTTVSQEAKKKELLLQKENVEALIESNNSKIAEFNNLISTIENEITVAKNKVEELSKTRDNQEKKVIDLRNDEKSLNSVKELSGRELARLEERKINLQSQYDNIISKLWEEYQLTKSEAEEVSVKIENISEAQKRLSELKQKIKALGSVNVGAIDEYKEVKERYDFLSKQVLDVEKSKKEIEKLISELTTEMKKSFTESFEEINKNFSKTFKELFGGGSASLELTDPLDVLNSGIDIKAQPPGKIVVHLEALSGGEKALVAIALYFSIMKVRPAPFCIMDEIEAALDEVNVDRFAQYLRSMTDNTQFILITHRRGTMEAADYIYGVTMEQRAISKVISLSLNEAEEITDII